MLIGALTKLALLAFVAALPGACAAPTSPKLTAYQRNTGPGSGVIGAPSSDMGRGTPGDEDVPGVSTGRSILGH